jgi:hypothetical protein
MPDSFFDEGDYPLHDEFSVAFLARLRDRAERWDTDVRPADTHAETSENPVIVGVHVPGLTGRITVLWIVCLRNEHQLPTLRGAWGVVGYPVDDLEGDPTRDLTVEGAPLTANELADLAGRWFEHHLTTDIYRDEWNWGAPSRRDAFGAAPTSRNGSRMLTRSVLERSAGFATGEQAR